MRGSRVIFYYSLDNNIIMFTWYFDSISILKILTTLMYINNLSICK